MRGDVREAAASANDHGWAGTGSGIGQLVRKWLPAYIAQNRHYLTVAVGCTGGQHRSVFVAEELGTRFRDTDGVVVRHRIIEQKALLSGEKSVQNEGS